MVGPESFNICMGGTFSPIHKGHIQLIREAFQRGNRVSIGLTSDIMANVSRDREVLPYEERLAALKNVLDQLSSEFGIEYSVREIHDRFGFAVKEEINAIVVSKETESTVDDIDRERLNRRLPPLKRFILDMVLDEGGERISSTRVVKGEIDNRGNIKPPSIKGLRSNRVCVHLGSKDQDKLQGVIRAFRRYWPEVQVFQYEIMNHNSCEHVEGPVKNAKAIVEELKKRTQSSKLSPRDHLVGIETGLIEEDGIYFLVICCYINSRDGEGFGMGPGLEIPPHMIENIMAYRGCLWETKDILGMRTSLIDNLSGGSKFRDTMVEYSCEMALLSLFNSLNKEGQK